MILITGGSGSGKSEYAESLLSEIKNTEKYYIATMKPFGKEAKERIQKHRRMRNGKGFITLEYPTDIKESLDVMDENSAVLIECISNLTANEMFGDEGIIPSDKVIRKIVESIEEMDEMTSRLVVVTNNVFEDGIAYDEATAEYIAALAGINTELARKADKVTEVVAGIPVFVK